MEVEEIYNFFFKGVPTTKGNFIKKVELLKLNKTNIKKLLKLCNEEFLLSVDLSEKDF